MKFLKNILIILSVGILVSATGDSIKIKAKNVTKIELVLPVQMLNLPISADNINGKTFILDKTNHQDFIKDFNNQGKEAKMYKSCAVIKIYMKDGTIKVFYGDGWSFMDISNNKMTRSFMFNENIIRKYWGFESDKLCKK